ncbi:MAG: HD domain-containing protein [Saccharofermentans sp.]|nr:HD domain-containing protein [Saccharofermentans sp.]
MEKDVNDNLSSAKRIPEYVRRIMKLINDSGYQAYVAGGAVRDIVLGKQPHDYDIATSAGPEEMIRIFKEAGIDYYDNAAKHGTVTAVTEHGDVEVTAFREDGSYSDLRRPDKVVFKTSIEDDVRRRDFTVNAMYMDIEGNISDPEGGQEDCSRHLIRAVGNPEKRFGEDALRILRGLRFCSTLGFDIEDNTLQAMEKCAGELKSISGERIASELTGIVTGRYASAALRAGWRILTVIIPEIGICHGFDQRSEFHDLDVFEHTLAVIDNIPFSEEQKRDPELAVAALFHDLGKPECFKLGENGSGHMKGHPAAGRNIAYRVLNELKCSGKFIMDVCLLVELHDTYVHPEKTEVHRFMSQYPEHILVKLHILQRADILAHSPLGQKRIKRLEEITAVEETLKKSGAVFDVKDLDITGNDIIRAGVPEGPEVGEVLNELFERYIDGMCINSKDSLICEARKLIGSKHV